MKDALNFINAANTENRKQEIINCKIGYIFDNLNLSFLQFSFNYVNKNNEFFSY